jgi:hypothetical protein
MEIM